MIAGAIILFLDHTTLISMMSRLSSIYNPKVVKYKSQHHMNDDDPLFEGPYD